MTLPAFLLAYVDSNLVWLGCKRFALPAVNAQWSAARVLAITVVHAAMGAGLGCLISLLAAGQLLGWLIWILGFMLTCQALVWTSLTALCWNQRVVRLRENPTLPLRLSPARFVLGRWALGLGYFAVLAVITPLAMLITVENVRGQLAWKHERERLVAQGERLTFRELLGPEIPPDQNAGAAPVFAPFFDHAPGEYPLRGESSKAVAHIKDRLTLPQLPKPAPDAPKTSREDTTGISMAEWSAAYRKLAPQAGKNEPAWVAELKLPPAGDPARDVLAGLSVAEPVLAQICAAAARPRAQFPVDWDEGFFALLAHLSVLKSAQQNLNLRCAAHLAVGETDAAFSDATNALNVAELLREEPLLISQLVRFAQGTVATRTLWQGLAEHRWSDAQLAALQERLGRVDYLSGMVLGFEGERATGIVGLEALIAGKSSPASIADGEAPPLTRVGRLVPFGMLRQNQAALARTMTELIVRTRARVSATSQTDVAAGSKPWGKSESAKLERTPYSPFNVMVARLLPALSNTDTKAARMQTTLRLAITACALERHRLAHGSYPETLDALVPAFLPRVPLDLMDGKPLRYRRTDDGWFLLYSVGEDGKDDGGVFRARTKDRIKDWPWPVPTRAEAGSLF